MNATIKKGSPITEQQLRAVFDIWTAFNEAHPEVRDDLVAALKKSQLIGWKNGMHAALEALGAPIGIDAGQI